MRFKMLVMLVALLVTGCEKPELAQQSDTRLLVRVKGTDLNGNSTYSLTSVVALK
jgi:hypothetical protein